MNFRSSVLASAGILAIVSAAGLAHGQSSPATTEVELKEPGTVLQATDTWTNWQTYWTSRSVVCFAPCKAVVPRDGKYQIAGVVGADIAPSSPFSLPKGEDVVLQVHRGSAAAHQGGGLLLVLGGISGFIGGMMLASSSGNGGTPVAGAITFSAGALMMLVGLPILLSSGTTVDFK
jgi:hypothetical protein